MKDENDTVKKVIEPYTFLFTEEERLIIKTRDVREKILDKFLDGTDYNLKTGEIRVLNELMNSMDDQTFKLSDHRLKDTSNSVQEDLSESILKIFTKVDETPSVAKTEKALTLEERYNPNDIVEGELAVEYKELTMSDLKG